MLKRFEDFETKMDYDDLIYILQDFEDEDVIIDKLVWKELKSLKDPKGSTTGHYFSGSTHLSKGNFKMTYESGYILVILDPQNSSGRPIFIPRGMTEAIRVFADRIKEYGWKIIQYSVASVPYKIAICKVDDQEMIQKSTKLKLI